VCPPLLSNTSRGTGAQGNWATGQLGSWATGHREREEERAREKIEQGGILTREDEEGKERRRRRGGGMCMWETWRRGALSVERLSFSVEKHWLSSVELMYN